MRNINFKVDVNKLGVNTPTIQQQFNRSQSYLKKIMPNGIVPNIGIQGQLNNALAQSSFQEAAQAQDVIMGALTLSSAVGVQVDNLLSPLGLLRKPATSTRVTITITGQPGKILLLKQNQTILLNNSNNLMYWCDHDIIIPSEGHIDSVFYCIQTGPIPCAANSSWSFTRLVSGVDSAINVAPGELGYPQESDFLYKWRASLLRGAQARSASLGYLENILMTNPIVANYYIFENPDPYNPVIKNGFLIPPGMFVISVSLTENTDQNWFILTKSLGGQRDVLRMASPDDDYRKVVTVQSENITSQILICNYISPKNVYIYIRDKYEESSSTPPKIQEYLSSAIYNNFIGLYPENMTAIPDPYRCLIGYEINTNRFMPSINYLNTNGIYQPQIYKSTTPNLRYEQINENDWGTDINISIFENPVLFTNNIFLIPLRSQ